MVSDRVLEGVRVLDLTAWQAGPTLTMILGDFGAEVLKVEAPGRLDGWRGGAGLLEDRAYEKQPVWLTVNRNKLGVSLDLKSETGRALFLRLVAEADVVAENFTPRVMESLGLGYDVLREVNDRIVLASLSGFGATGPWRDYAAFAFPTEEVSGLAFVNGTPESGPMLVPGHSVTDVLVGAMGAYAVLSALYKREATGQGDHIDLSQIETLTNFLSPELVDATINGRDPVRKGNTRPGWSPHGLFPCLPEGDHVAIAVGSDDEWRRLCEVISCDDVTSDESLRTVDGRAAGRERVAAAISHWTSTREGAHCVEQLQHAGVAAAVAARPSHLIADEQLWARQFFQIIDRAEVGAYPYPGPVVRLSRTPATFDRPPPLYGEHTAEVLKERLGLSDDELRKLQEAGVTSTEPAPQSWR